MILSLVSLISPIMGMLVILCIVIKNWNNTEHKNLKKYVFPLGMFFGTFGYSMTHRISETQDDLLRYFDMIKNLYNSKLNLIIKNDSDMLYTKDFLFFFVNRTGNMHILPFIVGFIIYSIVFYVLFDMISKSQKKFKTYEIILLGLISIGMISAYSIIGNIRCVFSYVLVSFAVYRELVQKKKNILTLLLYIISLGLHSSTIIIIMIRILSSLLKKFEKSAIFIALLLPQIINFAHEYIVKFSFGTIGKMITNAIDKAYYYLYWNEGGWATAVQNSLNDKVNRISGTIFLITIIILINKIKIESNDEKKNKKLIEIPMISYLYFVSLFALGCLTIKTGAFWRFEAIVVLFSPVILINAFKYQKNYKKTFTIFSLIGVTMFLINLIYQYRNLDSINTIINLSLTSGIKIFCELAKGIMRIFI